jgi:hypothetical protein
MSSEERLLRLEQSNRRLKAGMVAIGVVATALLILGAAAPTPRVITAEKFVLLDSSGRERAELSSNSKAAALQFSNADGSRALIVSSGSTDNAVIIDDKKGQIREGLITGADGNAQIALMHDGMDQDAFTITDDAKGTIMAIRDPNGNERVDVGVTPKGGSLAVADGNGRVRTAIADQGFVSMDPGGKLLWGSMYADMTPEERKRVIDIINTAGPPPL